MKKLEELVAMVAAAGDQKMLHFMQAVQMYVKNIHKHKLDKFLIDIDINSYRLQLLDSGLVEMIKGSNTKIDIFIADVLYISRHIWENITPDGEPKNGDDLHYVDPVRFPEEKMMTVNDTYDMLPYLQSVTDSYC